MPKKLTYASAGVKYNSLDPFKKHAQQAGRLTNSNIERFGLKEYSPSRGESAYLIETPDSYIAQVEEGLGTKNLFADAIERLTGKTYYDAIAQDTVAMIVNDLITLGALPLSVAMHVAVGDSSWFEKADRTKALIDGWKHACDLARCTWGGGETPTLKGIINPETVLLSGSAVGLVKPKDRLLTPEKIVDGDAIVFIESSGIHSNGLTLALKIADRLPQGYLTPLSDGRMFGEALLDPTYIYVPVVEDCLNQNVDLHYAVNITGHGWRKLMRAAQPFTYIIEQLPRPQPILKFLQEQGPIDDSEAYGNFNMGAGFALYLSNKDVDKVVRIAGDLGFVAFQAGYIKKTNDKKVVIKPKNLEFAGKTLAVR